ncbi:MAG: dynamin family protein [Pseudomonadota bacterium]
MTTTDDESGRPVIALMGEFSAGKSTLANMLLGEGHSQVKVTATQMPPVWFSYGTDEAYLVDVNGDRHPFDPEQEVDVASTRHIRVFAETEILDVVDIIDMPGNSDPNMSADVWRRAIHHADGVIWCSHANQAWRQSEAAVWEELPEELYQNSILLLTRFDKILGENNRVRVLRRVKSEAADLFRDVLPIALLDAMNAGDDHDMWVESGAEAFIATLLEIVLGDNGLAQKKAKAAAAEPAEGDLGDAPEADTSAGPVLPRRVARASGERRDRPEREERSGL